MINDIWQLAKHRENIVAIVGSDHLYGMVHHWKYKVVLIIIFFILYLYRNNILLLCA